MMGKFTVFSKPRYCPNAETTGGPAYAAIGDLVVFETLPDTDGATRRQLGRVLGLVNVFDNGEKPDGEHLVVLAANDSLEFGYERYVSIKNVRKVTTSGDFAKFFLFGEMPRPEVAIAAVKYGAMNDRVGKYLDDGEMRPTWMNRDKVGDGLKVRCPRCGGPVHHCETGDEGCHHCDDSDRCGWTGFLKDDIPQDETVQEEADRETGCAP